MTWPIEKPLTLPPAGTLLFDATPEQMDAVQEDMKRWRDAREWIKDRDKRELWDELQDTPAPYRDDMVRRLKEVQHDPS